jgi:hypothetical protein
MSTKTEGNYASETVREKRHEQLDEVYSGVQPDLTGTVTSKVEDGKGKSKELTIVFEGNQAVVETTGKVVLDRDGLLSLAKHASRAAQAAS